MNETPTKPNATKLVAALAARNISARVDVRGDVELLDGSFGKVHFSAEDVYYGVSRTCRPVILRVVEEVLL